MDNINRPKLYFMRSKIGMNFETLLSFDGSLLKLILLKKKGDIDANFQIKSILRVLKPIYDNFNGKLSENFSFDEKEVSKGIQILHSSDWETYINRYNILYNKFESNKISGINDFEILILKEISKELSKLCSSISHSQRKFK